ncbi:restriction endonuclease subunit S [Acetobacter persici]|uniref:restriction endonuclease subunit S n=1 Tax=Acetobacter persici TaxID=1076596 RepID=UPI002013995A|nr:restriction endonuclease subunit S [Acetobacter persici]
MLPQGWVEADIGELCNLVNGKAFKPSEWSKTGLPIIRIQNLNNSQALYNYYDREIPDKFLVNKGDLLFAWSGTPGTSFGAHLWMGQKAILNQHIFKIIFNELDIDKNYFKIAINSTLHELIGKAHGGVGLAHVTKGKFETTKLPLPPLAEQRRIVAKLDSLTARIARARAELERVQQLREAFTARFLRKIFSAEIEKYFPLNEVITSIDAGKNLKCEERPPKKNEQGVVKVSAVSSEIFRPEEAKTLPQSYLPPKRDLITNGDVLLARASGSLKLVGRIAVAERCDGNLYLSDKVLRINIDKTWKDWVVWFLRSPLGREQIESFSSGISMHNIGQNNFKRIKIPFVNLPGRERKISSLIRGLKHINHLEAEAQRALTLLNRLEASLLVKAFRGELVPQDPKDEPASALLDRIRAERAAAPKPKRGRKQPTRDMPLPRKRPTEKHG